MMNIYIDITSVSLIDDSSLLANFYTIKMASLSCLRLIWLDMK